MKDREPTENQEGILIFQNPTSVREILGGQIPVQPSFATDQVKKFYYRLAEEGIFSEVRTFGDKTEFTIVGPSLTGEELQQVFHFAAPSKTFGVDYNDTQNDWHNLYASPDNKYRLAAHRGIYRWEIFQQHREKIRSFIRNDFEKKAADDDLMTPVIRIGRRGEKLFWNFDPLTANQKSSIFQKTDKPVGELMPALGPLFIKAFSPKITWPPSLNYRLGETGATQDMGSTQTLVLTLAKADELFDCRLLRNLLQYAETGEILDNS